MQKINKLAIGIAVGLILPLIIFLGIYLFNKEEIEQFGQLFIQFDLHVKAFTISIIPNLILFYFLLQKNYIRIARGILMVSFLYIIAFLILFIS